MGLVGDDFAAAELSSILNELSVDLHFTKIVGRPTTHKLRIVAAGQQVVRVDLEDISKPPMTTVNWIGQEVDRLAAHCDAIVVSDYDKGACAAEVVSTAIRAAADHRIPVLCDPKGRDFGKYADATLITPNRKEASDVIGSPIASWAEAETAAVRLARELRLEACLVTLGAQGMLLAEESKVTPIEAFPHEVADVSGAGDAVIAALSLGLTCGLDLRDACILANAAGGVAVTKAGSAAVSFGDLVREYRAAAPDGKWSAKIVDRRALAHDLKTRKAAGDSVVFTNGCFDLLHVGHVDSLMKAASLGDVLVVAVNSDASVKRLKGPTRPIVSESDRALLLAAVSCVDYVVIFGEDTPEQLIEAVVPDVLVKGMDYAEDEVVGADFVRANGGKVVLVPLRSGLSTSAMISSIAKAL